MNASVVVRAGTGADAERALSVLHRSITLACVADHQNDAQTLAHWLDNKTPERFEQWLAEPDGALLVAEVEGTVRGVGKVTRAGKVELCYVEPGFERRGIGTVLLLALEERARRFGASRLHLNSSLGARSFYVRHGYEPTGPAVECMGTVRCFPFASYLTRFET